VIGDDSWLVRGGTREREPMLSTQTTKRTDDASASTTASATRRFCKRVADPERIRVVVGPAAVVSWSTIGAVVADIGTSAGFVSTVPVGAAALV
jgi:hypothetical protein